MSEPTITLMLNGPNGKITETRTMPLVVTKKGNLGRNVSRAILDMTMAARNYNATLTIRRSHPRDHAIYGLYVKHNKLYTTYTGANGVEHRVKHDEYDPGYLTEYEIDMLVLDGHMINAAKSMKRRTNQPLSVIVPQLKETRGDDIKQP